MQDSTNSKAYLDAYGQVYVPEYCPLFKKNDLYNYYLKIIPVIRQVARDLGYAIGVHGTLSKDLDLIAVPWTVGQSNHLDLLESIQMVIAGYKGLDHKREKTDDPYIAQDMPHGRRSYIIWIGVHAHIDIAITPVGKQL